MRCEDASAAFLDYLEELPEPGLRREIEEHLAACSACRASLERSRKALSLLDEWQPRRPAARRPIVGGLAAAAALLLALTLATSPSPAARVVDGAVTLADGRARTDMTSGALELPDESRIDLAPDTDLLLARRRVELARGSAMFHVTRQGEPFTVKTSVADIQVLGTRFEAILAGGALEVRVREGSVRIANAKGGVVATAFERVRVEQDAAPVRMGSEEPLPPGALARLGTTTFRHGGLIRAVACSPDGKLVAASGGDTLHVWNVGTGKVEATFRRPGNFIEAIAFSPDGKTLISGGWRETEICLWDVAAARQIDHFSRVNDALRHVGFFRDGRPVVWGGDMICTHEVATKTTSVASWGGREVCPSPDGTSVAILEEGSLRLRDAKTKKDRWTLTEGEDRFQLLVFSPDGTLLAAHTAGSISVLDVASGKRLHFWGELATSESIEFSRDNAFLAASASRVWDLATGRVTAGLHVGAVGGVSFHPSDKRVFFGGRDGTLLAADCRTGKMEASGAGHEAAVNTVGFSPDGARIASSAAGTTRLWDTRSGQELAAFEGPDRENRQVAFSPDGKMLAASGNHLSVWDVEARRPILDVDDHGDSVAFSRDGRTLLAAGDGRGAGAWTLPGGQQVFRRPDRPPRMGEVDLSRDGTRFAWGPVISEGPGTSVFIHDVATGLLEASFGGDGRVDALALSPDGKMIAWSTKGALHVGVLATGKELPPFAPCGSLHRALAFSPDGRAIAAGSDEGEVVLLEVASGRDILRLRGHQGRIASLAFAPDGSRLASGSGDTTILIWDLREKVEPARDLEGAWADLGADDAAKGWRAIAALAANPESAAFLGSRLKGPDPAPPERLRRLLADLDRDDYATREKATDELRGLGAAADAALRRALADPASSPEVKARVGDLLRALDAPTHASGEALRRIRGMQVLERLRR
jgi:WD40 repeat protein/ferric-dicitrate binding protein FerR (iron transport regulator)